MPESDDERDDQRVRIMCMYVFRKKMTNPYLIKDFDVVSGIRSDVSSLQYRI